MRRPRRQWKGNYRNKEHRKNWKGVFYLTSFFENGLVVSRKFAEVKNTFWNYRMALAATPTSNSPSMSLTTSVATSGANSNGNSSSNELRFSCHTLDKATKAKLTLENYYSTLISQHKERKDRWKRLEDSLRVKLFVLHNRWTPALFTHPFLFHCCRKSNIVESYYITLLGWAWIAFVSETKGFCTFWLESLFIMVLDLEN